MKNIFKKDKELYVGIAWFMLVVAIFDLIRSVPYVAYLIVPAIFFGFLIFLASCIGRKTKEEIKHLPKKEEK